jgi:hypothetical protein
MFQTPSEIYINHETQNEQKPCVCGGKLYCLRGIHGDGKDGWLCTRGCGAQGSSYAEALRNKLELEALVLRDMRREVKALLRHSTESE